MTAPATYQRRRSNVTAIIPARGGSKGVPRKNIRPLGDKPLIAYSIEAALKAKLVDRVIVSTDDPAIADIAMRFGAEVPFLRPAALARDDSPIHLAIDHVQTELWRREGAFIAQVVVLYPSHPFRTPALIDSVVGKLQQGHSPVGTVRRIPAGGTTHFAEHGGTLQPLMKRAPGHKPQSYFRNYGLVQGHITGVNNKPYSLEIEDEISLIDIDTPYDFAVAEEVVASGLFDFDKTGLPHAAHPATPAEGSRVVEF
ncbi:acylneuraminate cytidylyltransferase family protein [Salidesulfovibrio brasiliensis]|uniref:acylneuraminate cytidylyltransferase family protein n=1 Tax=Salidesulfovibrio brasiliensis TaxID=221711 RepID=UPI0006D192F3|nr:acylneuraminate cytidylyltransferase family protein [Salidesulfovibrio brasiliensis]